MEQYLRVNLVSQENDGRDNSLNSSSSSPSIVDIYPSSSPTNAAATTFLLYHPFKLSKLFILSSCRDGKNNVAASAVADDDGPSLAWLLSSCMHSIAINSLRLINLRKRS